MKLYKLTDRDGTQWGPGVSHSGTGEGGLWGPGWIHAYESPLIAVLMNPVHANFKNPQMWEAEGEIGVRGGQFECGCKTLTTIREIPLPEITTAMRVRFAILSSKEVFTCRVWNAWADKWLSDEDRTQSAAYAARAVARAAAEDARAALLAAESAKARALESASARPAEVWTVRAAVAWTAKAAAAARAEADAAMAAAWATEAALAEVARVEAKAARAAAVEELAWTVRAAEANAARAAAAAMEWAAAAAARVGKRIWPDGWMRMVLTYENH